MFPRIYLHWPASVATVHWDNMMHVLLRFSSTGLSALSIVLRSLLNRLMQQFLS